MRKMLFVLYVSIMAIFLPSCDSSSTAPPDSAPYIPVEAGQLAPTGCETYTGAHPTHPGDLLCCSQPSSGSAPKCAPGDTPDIPCVLEFEFCEDGTAKKALSPQPESGYPGHTISTEGSWSVNPASGQLTIITTSTAMDGAMITVTTETYPTAFTYDNGNKLDIYSSAATDINDIGIGSYHRDAASLTEMSGLWAAILDADLATDVTVTTTGDETRFEQNIVCDPPESMVCVVVPATEETITPGTHTLPSEPLTLFITPAGDIMYQSEAAKVLVLERQPDPCLEIDCGAHGSCEYGACVCTDGYTGKICDEETPCVGVNCGENGTCVVEGSETTCECDTGYEGIICETDINECSTSPCLNGGTCAEGIPGTYECTCTGGFAGDNCEICPEDADGDGYGDPASSLCIHPGEDCDDTQAAVYPGAPELCDNLDNQCAGDPGYGTVDEGYTNCGDMVPIPFGCFDMGDAFADGRPDELPVHNVCLSAFEMDVHEITNAEYAECVAAEECTAPSSSASYSRPSYYGNPDYDNYPAIWMWWDDIDNYCTWAGKRLPTEAEWEYAARGGLEGKRYPWGDSIDCAMANYGRLDYKEGSASMPAACAGYDGLANDTSPVESYAANGYGLYDMAGNVWEWVADWFDETFYSVSPTNDPTGPASGMAHVRRGGSWDHSDFGLRAAARCDFCHADRHGNNLGGRCAR